MAREQNGEPFSGRSGKILAVSILAGCLSAIVGPTPGAAEDYYKGKTITMVIGSNPGGGTDTTARLVARFWANHIPGRPEMLIRNKGVQIMAANELHHNVRPDGLTVAAFAAAGSLGPVRRGSSNVKYNPLEWGIIGGIERGSDILLVRKSALPRLTDRKAPPVAFGSVSTDRPQDAMAVFGSEYLGWNLKIVLGYPSSSQMYIAYEQGEIDMLGSSTDDIIRRFLTDGGATPLGVESTRPDYADVPTFEQVFGDKKPQGLAWRAFTGWSGGGDIDKYFTAPPKTPDNLLSILRTSFLDTAKDPKFVKEAGLILGEGVRPSNAAEILEAIRAEITTDPEVSEFIRKMREKYGLPQLSKLK